MAEEWVYDADEWNRTRVVEVFQAEDGLWYWRRSRIKGGVSGKVVAVSGGFEEEHWARVSAAKENYPLPVGNVVEPDPDDPPVELPPGDDPVDPTVPPGPEPGEPEPVPDDGNADDVRAKNPDAPVSKPPVKSTAKAPEQKKQVSK